MRKRSSGAGETAPFGLPPWSPSGSRLGALTAFLNTLLPSPPAIAAAPREDSSVPTESPAAGDESPLLQPAQTSLSNGSIVQEPEYEPQAWKVYPLSLYGTTADVRFRCV